MVFITHFNKIQKSGKNLNKSTNFVKNTVSDTVFFT